MVCTVSRDFLTVSQFLLFRGKFLLKFFFFFLPGGNTVCGPSVVSKRKANENGIYLFTHFHLKSRFYGK